VNIALLFNPASGRGRRGAAVDALSEKLRQDGHRVLKMHVGGPEMEEVAARQTLAATDVLLIAGGDGTINRALPMAIASGAAVYHVPMGTENLFAREFGMKGDAGSVRRAIEKNDVRAIDTAECNGRPFVLMCSVGPDADVIYRLASGRKGGISHLSYVGPIVKEAITGKVVPISVGVDDQILFEDRRGMIVVANSKMYGFGANPASTADVQDGMLEVVFFPAPFSLAAGGWLSACILGISQAMPGRIAARGKHVMIVASKEEGFRCQMDGETFGDGRTEELEIRVREGSLRVLMP
jgi:diacylglycerol kinase (ATP)